MLTFPAFCFAVLLVGNQPDKPSTGQVPPSAASDEAAPKSLADEFKELIPTLIEALEDPDDEVRNHASEALVDLGREAVPALLQAITGKRTKIRSEAARVVGRMASEGDYVAREAIPSLLKALKDEDKEVKQAASFAVKQLVKYGRPNKGFGGGGF